MPLTYSQNYDWSTQAPPPNSGQVRTNTQNWATATVVSVHDVNNDGRDLTELFLKVSQGSALNIQQANNAANFAQWTISGAPVNNDTYWSFPVTLNSSGGSLPGNNANCVIQFVSAYSTADALYKVYIDPEDAGTFLVHLARLFSTDRPEIDIYNAFMNAAYAEWGYSAPYTQVEEQTEAEE